MTLAPSQQAWADEQIGTERSVAHTGTITKVERGKGKDAPFVTTVTDADGRSATFELAAPQDVADQHRGVESTVLVAGTVSGVIEDPASNRVGLVVTGANGETVEWVQPPPMTEAEHAERYPAPAPVDEEQAQADQAEAQSHYFKDQILAALDDPEFAAAVRAALEG